MFAASRKCSQSLPVTPEIKQEAQEIFAALGMDMTTAINVFLRQAIYYRGFPFDVRIETFNEEMKAAFEEVEQMKKDPSIGKAYTDVDEMMKELLS